MVMESTDKEIDMIGIVTVLYNSGPVLEDFFNSLEKQTYKDFRLYVIDNKSSDNSVEITKTLMKDVSFETVLFEEQTNWGVAKGNNIGIKKALKDGCSHVLLSNNDTLFDENTIKVLYDAIKEENASMVVPKIYFWNTDKRIWCAGGYFSWLLCTSMHYGDHKQDNGEYDERKIIKYCPTCYMLIRSDVFSRVGLMDEKYFVYTDDADFCWRATMAGKEKMIYIPTSVVYHKESYSTGGVYSDFGIRYISRNRVYFALKHYSFIHKIYYFIYIYIIHYLLSDIRKLPFRQQKLMFKSYREGWELYHNK